ncbi:Exocyst complex component EXO70B1 [Linum perenne]
MEMDNQDFPEILTNHPSSSPPASEATLEEVDRFIELLSQAHEANSDPPPVPEAVESMFKSVESMIGMYDDNSSSRFGQNEGRDSLLLAHLNRVSKLIKIFNDFSTTGGGGGPESDLSSTVNRAGTIHHLAMSFLDSEFRTALNNFRTSSTPNARSGIRLNKQSSFSRNEMKQQHHRVASDSDQSNEDDDFPGYQPEDIYNMSKIAAAMISSGYDNECRLVYESVRRTSINNKLEKHIHVNSHITSEEINKMDWETLEAEIASMIDQIHRCSSTLFSAERNLCDAVFGDHSPIYQEIFGDLVSTMIDRFINFANVITSTKCSAEKLFKFLDMYETLCKLRLEIENFPSQSEFQEMINQLGQSAVSMFCELENSIRGDNSRTPVPNGGIHPLTRYTMNYLKYACEYKDTLEQLFLQKQNTDQGSNLEDPQPQNPSAAAVDTGSGSGGGANEDGTPQTSPFSVQLNTVMDLLDENLEVKSHQYKDPALGYIFLMNNGRYILQKIKSSTEIHDMMGVTWCRRRSSDLRKYHKEYTRETWGRVLHSLRHDGILVNGKVAKPMLKERFKMFNNVIDDIHKTQTSWVVADEQLQSELRVSVSAVVIPAYRSFLGKFQQYLGNGRQTEKYIKYQPEDIENVIEGLFEGNPAAVTRKKP